MSTIKRKHRWTTAFKDLFSIISGGFENHVNTISIPQNKNWSQSTQNCWPHYIKTLMRANEILKSTKILCFSFIYSTLCDSQGTILLSSAKDVFLRIHIWNFIFFLSKKLHVLLCSRLRFFPWHCFLFKHAFYLSRLKS